MRLTRLRLSNFLSYREEGADLRFDGPGAWVVRGTNLDAPAEGPAARNGAGKSALLHGVHYALFGQPAAGGIRLPDLVNSVSGRAMRVLAVFACEDGRVVEIERGRGPEFVSWRVLDPDGSTRESGAGGSDAAARLAAWLPFDVETFRATALLDAARPSVFAMGMPERRALLGPVLGLSAFDRRAEVFRRTAAELRAGIAELGASLRAARESARATARDARRRAAAARERLERVREEIARLSESDPEEEIRRHRENAELDGLIARRGELAREASGLLRRREALERDVRRLREEIERLQGDTCPACGTPVGDPDGSRTRALRDRIAETEREIAEIDGQARAVLAEAERVEAEIRRTADGGRHWEVRTSDAAEAARIGERLRALREEAARLEGEIEAEGRRAADAESSVDDDAERRLRESERDLEAVKLLVNLTSRDDSPARRSFVRARVRNLRERMEALLAELGFEGRVEVRDDFSLDTWGCSARAYGTLSRGERARVDLAWQLALHAETLPRHGIRTLLVDEALDEGMDAEGLERAWRVLVGHARGTGSTVLVASNRSELIDAAGRRVEVVRRAGRSHAAVHDEIGGGDV